jgi:hypothetical protein
VIQARALPRVWRQTYTAAESSTAVRESYGAPMMQAFVGEPDIRKAVAAFCKATVDNATGDRRTGCMMASAVLGQSE